MDKLTTSDKVVAGSGLLLFIASFLPWFGVEGFNVHGNGWDVGFFWGGIPALLGLAAAGVVLATKLGDVKLPDLPITWGQAILAAGAPVGADRRPQAPHRATRCAGVRLRASTSTASGACSWRPSRPSASRPAGS